MIPALLSLRWEPLLWQSGPGDNTGVNLSATAGGADYLSIKSTVVASNDTVRRWTWLRQGGTKDDDLSGESFVAADRIIVISPGSSATNSRSLIISAGAFSNTYNNTAGYAPADATEIRLVYGVDGNTALRMPFNRADYYIRRPAAGLCLPSVLPIQASSIKGLSTMQMERLQNSLFLTVWLICRRSFILIPMLTE